MGKKALGRGFGAILGDKNILHKKEPTASAPVEEIASENKIQEIPVGLIDPNPYQPRTEFSTEEIQELAETIKSHGLIQPIVLRKRNDRYQIVSGERRFRAYQYLKSKTVPARVHTQLSDKQMMELALIENIQRVQLSAIEEARAYDQLVQNHGYRHEDLGNILGKSRSAITNTLRLLKLPIEVQEWVKDGSLSAGHARNLLSPDIKDPLKAAQEIINKGMSVRQSENERQKASGKPPRVAKAKDPNIVQFENDLRYAMGTDVQINQKGKGGKLEIYYNDLHDLNRIREILLHAAEASTL